MAADTAADADDAAFQVGPFLDQAAIADQAVVDPGILNQRSRQVAHTRVDDPLHTGKVKGRLVAGQGHVGLVVRFDRTEIVPVAIEDVDAEMVLLQTAGNTPRTRSTAVGWAWSISCRARWLNR